MTAYQVIPQFFAVRDIIHFLRKRVVVRIPQLARTMLFPVVPTVIEIDVSMGNQMASRSEKRAAFH